MKKILAVLIAISMVATMAFAADFEFEVKSAGDIAAWELATPEKATLLSRDADKLTIKLDAKAADERAGASATIANTTVKSYDAAAYDAAVKAWKDAVAADAKAGNTNATAKWKKDYKDNLAAAGEADGSFLVVTTPDPDKVDAFRHSFTVSNSYLTATNTAIWIKPVDGVKLSLDKAKFSAWAGKDFDGDTKAEAYGEVESDGFKVEITKEFTTIEDLEIDLGIKNGIVTTDVLAKTALAAKVAYTGIKAANIAVTADTNLNAGAAVSGKVVIVDDVAAVNYVAAVDYKNVGKAVKVAEEVTFDLTKAHVTVMEAVQYDVAGKDLKALETLTLTLKPVTVTQNAKYTADAISADVKAEAKFDDITVPCVDNFTVSCKAESKKVTEIATNLKLSAAAKAELKGNLDSDSAEWKVTPTVVAELDKLADFSLKVNVPFEVVVKF